MNGRDFLTVAHDLASAPAEPHRRSAVSRAYYAAFHVARNLLTALGFRVPNGDRAHGYLWLRLQNCNDTDLREAAVDLKRLRSDRNEADYDLRGSFSVLTVASLIDSAEEISHVLDTGLAEPTRTRITDAMKI